MAGTEDAAETAQAAAEADDSRPSALDLAEQLRVFKADFREDSSHSANWRTVAKTEFEFLAGEQWTPDEKAQLKEAMRPEIVFNRTITIIKAVAGFEINGRHEIQFLPRTLDDAAVNEVLTGASKWMADECDGEDEESEAFQDTLVCGMGWCEHRLDYEIDYQGQYVEDHVDPLEMYWDRAARKKNLADARRIWRVRKMSVGEAKGLFPGKTRLQLDAKWAVGDVPEEQAKSLEQKRIRDENEQNVTERDEVHIVERQWYEREPMWLVADQETDSVVKLTDAQYQTLVTRGAEFGMEFKAQKINVRRYKRAFIGSEVLESGEGPIPDRFTYTCITGQLDKIKGIWFGLIRIMRDPAKWANKWLSQTLHIMNANAKGGILAEPDAFDDQRQAEESYAKPESITWMKKGALGGGLTGGASKWAPKPMATFPQGFYQLLEFAISSLRDVTGINLELLGQKDVMQPGILEAQRKQAGMTVLATMFDSLRRFRKQVGRIRLYYIQTYLSDGRLIRITGPEGAKGVQLLKDKTVGEYDVVVDDTPTSPNQKQANWAIVAPLIPMFKAELAQNPPLLVEILKYSPLPSRLVASIETILTQPPSPEAQQAQELAKAAKVAAINKDQSTAEMQNAKAGATQATAMYDIAMAQRMMANKDFEGLATHLDAMHKAATIDTERAKADTEGAKADQIRSQTGADHAGAAADVHNTHADTVHKTAQTAIAMLSHAAGPQQGGQ